MINPARKTKGEQISMVNGNSHRQKMAEVDCLQVLRGCRGHLGVAVGTAEKKIGGDSGFGEGPEFLHV